MSYVGGPYEYDVFVSYAHAETETEASLIRNWSQHVAGRLRDLLATALNVGVGPDSGVKVFLDDRECVSGQPLTQMLRDRAQRSALLLVLMGPLYPTKGWCLDELDWFFMQAAKDGRSQEHCTVLRIQPLDDEAWPGPLRDERKKPILFHDFVDPDTELPVGLDDFKAPQLSEALRPVFIELKEKLKTLRKQLEARRVYHQAAVEQSAAQPPVQPILYLQARQQDAPHWQATRGELEPLAIVHPDEPSVPVGDDALLQQQREMRLREYAECDGLVLLRTGADEAFRIEVMAAYNDRKRLFQRHQRNIPWAVVDREGCAPAVYSAFRVPCVAATSPDWPSRLMRTLGLADPPA